MKKKFVIVNVIAALAVLLAMLFQSFHSFEHLELQLKQKSCQHHFTSKHQITHQHHNIDHCLLCDLQISSYIASEIAAFELRPGNFCPEYCFSASNEIVDFFKGSLFLHRGPPVFIT